LVKNLYNSKRFDRSVGRSDDDRHPKMLEIYKIKKEIETADRIFCDELASEIFSARQIQQ
jgi:hypothetical protein